jgi:hypothetical protein
LIFDWSYFGFEKKYSNSPSLYDKKLETQQFSAYFQVPNDLWIRNLLICEIEISPDLALTFQE